MISPVLRRRFTRLSYLLALLTLPVTVLLAQSSANDVAERLSYKFGEMPIALPDTDEVYTGKPLNDVPTEKATGCTNTELSNPGFESGLDPWRANAGARVVSGGNGEYVFSGHRSLKLDQPEAWAGQYFDLGGHRHFCFSAYAKNHASRGTVLVGVKFWDANNHLLGESTKEVGRSSSYNQYTIDGTTPAGTVTVEVFTWRSSDAQHDSWVDQLCFQDKGGDTNCELTDLGHWRTESQIGCIDAGGSFEPNLLDVTAATCADGSAPDYQWQRKLSDDTPWTDVHGATGEDYAPGHLERGKYSFRRGAKCPCADQFEYGDARGVHVQLAPSFSITSTNVNCDGSEAGSITFTFGDDPDGIFHEIGLSINGGDDLQTVPTNSGSFTFTNLSAGDYVPAARFIGGNCVVSVHPITILGSDQPTVTAFCGDTPPGPDDDDQCPAICAGESIRISALGAGGRPPYTYSWSNGLGGGQTQTVSPVETTGYTVTITDSDGCTGTDHVRIKVNGAAWDDVSLGHDVSSCDGGCDGSFIADPNFNLTGPYFVEYTFGGGVVRFPATGELTGTDPVTVGGLCVGTYSGITIVGAHTGCRAVWPGDIVIGRSDGVNASILASTASVCSGEPVTFSAATEGNEGAVYTWLFGPGSAPASAQGPGPHQVTYTVPAGQLGNNRADVTLSVANGECSAMDTVEITVLDLLQAAITSSSNPSCSSDGGSITLSFADNPNRTNIDWSLDGGNTFPLTTTDDVGAVTVDGLAAGTYDVVARWGNDDCPVAVDRVTLIEEPEPTVSAGEDQTVCTGGSATLSVTSAGTTGAVTYTWDNGAGAGAEVVVTPSETTTYTVTGVDENGCEASDEVTVTVVPGPVVEVNNEIICVGETVTLTAAADGGGGALSYAWSTGESTAAIEVSPTATTDYTITVTATEGAGAPGCSVETTATVTVNELPEISLSSDAGTDATICSGEITTLTAAITGGEMPYTIAWREVGTDEVIGTEAALIVLPTETTTYEVSVSDANGCAQTGTIEITVDPTACARLGDFVFFDADGDGVQDAGEAGIEGVAVALLDGEGEIAAVTTTDGSGLYLFDELSPGTYSVVFEAPDGLTLSPANRGADDGADSDAGPDGATEQVTLARGETNLTLDAGYFTTASLGDFVFLDDNANGIQDTGEEGLEGVPVNLLSEGGDFVSSTTTDPNGFYQFVDLLPGTPYQVEFPTDNGLEISPVNVGDDTNDANDSDADPVSGRSQVVVLEPGENNPTIDAGYFELGSIGDQVFLDDNQDGIQDEGEAGIEGVPVELLDADGEVLATTTTDANGNYLFDELTPGDYVVRFPVDNGLTISPTNQGDDDENDSDADRTTGETGTITLTSGENDLSNDTGYFEVEAASLGDFVFLDQNANGIQDAEDEGVGGAIVSLLVDDEVVATTTTNEDGFYEFTDLTPGEEYQVEFPTDNGLEISPVNEGDDDATDSDADPVSGRSQVVVLEPGENNPTIDAGYFELGSIGNLVFLDEDQDGIQDEGEAGIEGVPVELLDADGEVLATTTTDANGNYLFDELAPGDYVVRFPVDNGLTISPTNQGDDDENDSDADRTTGETGIITLTSGENDLSNDAGYFEVEAASLGDYVFLDQNANGIQDADDEGIADVTINLLDAEGEVVATTTTNEDGFYEFTDLTPGEEYQVEFPTDNGLEISPANVGDDTNDANDSDADPVSGRSQVVVLAPGENNPTIDAGYFELGSIGDQVFLDDNQNGIQDEGEAGIEGVPVELLDADGEVLATTTTDADGNYLFDELTPGDYVVRFPVDNGLTISPTNQGDDDENDSDADRTTGETGTITLTSGENDLSNDAGYFEVEAASLGDFVFLDQNANGVQDAEDEGVEGAIVSLLVDDEVVATTTTDEDGFYEFTDLTPGEEYQVEFPTDNGLEISPANVDDNTNDANDSDADPVSGRSQVVVLEPGENNPTIDAGYFELGSIGNLVFLDDNQDGIQDEGEAGIEGVPVELLDADGEVLATTTTDADGNYLFDELTPGDYVVRFPVDNGLTISPTNQGDDDENDSDADRTTGETGTITLTSGENDLSNDAGYFEVEAASLGDYVFLDQNANGIQDADDEGIADVAVNLLDAEGEVVATTTTNDNGFYEFTDLTPGEEYQVEFPTDNGLEISPANVDDNTNDANDSDADPVSGRSQVVVLEPGENNPTIDAGYFELGSIGDLVFLDDNQDGIQDEGGTGIEGVPVELLDADGEVLATTTTDANGNYLFDELAPGDYVVRFPVDNGLTISPTNQGDDDENDSDADRTTGETGIITLTSGEDDLSNDAGYFEVEAASLGDYVFLDQNANGIQDADDEGIADVTINLLDAEGEVVATTTTNEDGFYEFTDLTPGEEYQVEFPTDNGLEISPANVGDDTNDANDSDADPVSGRSQVVVLAPGENNPTIDAGYFELGSIGDLVFLDDNQDGIQNEGEAGIEGVPVELLDADGEVLATTTTDTNGNYLFDELAPGDYIVRFPINNGLEVSPANQGDDDNADSDNDPATGETAPITLTSGEDDLSVDAGYFEIEPASLGDFVFLDQNANGVQDAEDEGIADVAVNLLDAEGEVVATTSTNEDGFYEFTDLTPGEEYQVEFPTDNGLEISPVNEGDDDATDSDADQVSGRSQVVELEPGENNPTIDAGYFELGSIGDRVFLDDNQDGIQDEGEAGIEGVPVELLDADGEVLATTTTDADGNYLFDELAPGDYVVRFPVDNGLTISPTNQGDDDENDSDADRTTGETGTITLTSGEDDPSNDAGYFEVEAASLGDYVFLDQNANGVQDAEDEGIADVAVNLLDAEGEVVATTTTNDDGFYEFTDLTPGEEYQVEFPTDNGLEISPVNEGDDDATDSDADPVSGRSQVVVLEPGENNPTIDAGYFELGSIGDQVFLDDNQDGIQDEGEAGIEGVPVELLDADGEVLATTTTDADGNYLFDELTPGDYIVRFPIDNGLEVSPANRGDDDTTDSDIDPATGETAPITLTSGEDDLSVDAGYFEIEPASLGDFVFLDQNANGIQDAEDEGVEGAIVSLLVDDEVVATTSTNEDGFYEFTDLTPGEEYQVEFPTDNGLEISPVNEGDDDATDSDADLVSGRSQVVVLEPGENNPTIDAGYFELGSIGDQVFLDEDQDGIQDEGEAGIEGVPVELLDADGEVLATTTTDANGNYLFDELAPGDYIVRFPIDNGLEVSPPNQGDDDTADSDVDPATGETAPITLTSGEDDLSVDAGYFEIERASLGDFVFLDQNANGIQDADDEGIADVAVNLLDATGEVVATTSTNEDGFYEFTDLTPGEEYQVEFPTDNGLEISPANVDDNTNDANDSDADPVSGRSQVVVLEPGENNPTTDAGYFELGSIGDQVFLDDNQDGIQDEGEAGIEGVPVELLDADGEVLATTTTDADGNYLFDELTPGDYIVRFPLDNGLEVSPANRGDDDTTDSDIDPATGETAPITLTSGEDDLSVDAGYFEIEPASLGDFVFLDQNANGIQDAEDEGIADVAVNLLDAEGEVVATTATNENGFYEFTELTPGEEYQVEFPTDNGLEISPANVDDNTNDANDSDADPVSGRSQVVVLEPGENNPTIDAGYFELGSIGDQVFLDDNQDGIQDEGEAGIEGVPVELLDADGEVLATTTTDANGNYLFDELAPGDYIVRFPIDNGLEVSPPNQGDDDTADSDIDPATGETAPITLTSGEDDLSVDAGYFEIEPASLGDFVFLDQNANGIQDAEDEGIADVTINLLDAEGEVTAMTTTNEDGFYEFTDLTPGEEYQVEFPTDNGLEISPVNEGDDDATDSDADPVSGRSQVVVLEPGENNLTIDAGYFELGSIGDFVFEDTNGDGLQSPGEPGIEGVAVDLKDEDGNVIATTTTDENGNYAFNDLTPGTYSVRFDLPTAFNYTTPNAGDEAGDSDADPAMNGMTEPITLTSGETNNDLDAGLQLTPAITTEKAFVSAAPQANGTYLVTYTIDVVNTGGAGVYSLTDTPAFDDDVVISGGSYSGADAGALNGGGATILTQANDIAANATESFELIYTVTLDLDQASTDTGDNVYTACGNAGPGGNGAPGQGLYNTVSLDVNSDGTIDDEADACGDLPQFDLALSKSPAPASAPYIPGGTVAYNVTVTNEGDIDATDVTVTDTPAEGLTFQSLTPQDGITDLGAGTFAVADLAAGASVEVTLTFLISADFEGTTLNNAAEITEDGPFDDVDSNPATGPETDEDGDGDGDDDDEDNADITITQPQIYDLELTKSIITEGPYTPGAELGYDLILSNTGEVAAANVEVTDTPGPGLIFASLDANPNVSSTGAGTFLVAALAPGTSETITVRYTLDPAYSGTSITNDAQITADDGDDIDSDPDTGPDVDEDGDGDGDDDDEDTVTIPVEQTPSVDIEKGTLDPVSGLFLDADEDDPATNPLYVWGVTEEVPTVQWQYVVTNDGTVDLIDIEVTDDQVGPIGTIARLAVGESDTLTASETAQRTFDGVYRNLGTATAQPVDQNGDPNGDQVADTDPSHYEGIIFNIDKMASESRVCEGSEVDYTITLRLDGQSRGQNARMVTVTDTLFDANDGIIEVVDIMRFFDESSNPNGNDRIDNGEEWVFNYSRVITETARNKASEMFDIYRGDRLIRMISGDSSQTVTIIPAPEIVVAEVSNENRVFCNGDDTGTVRVDVLAGREPFTYEWSGGTAVADFPNRRTDLSAGVEYYVTVTGNSALSCFSIDTFQLEEPSAILIVGVPSDVTCAGESDGAIDVTVTGGLAPYTYAWEGAETTLDTEDLTGLSAGTYTVTATDANGCESAAAFAVTEPTELTASIEAATLSCADDVSASLTVVATGGTQAYGYAWSTGATTATVNDLVAGDYSVTVTDANGCEVTVVSTIEAADGFTTSISSSAVGCFGEATGRLSVTNSGGAAPYSYAWSDGAETADRTGLSAGNYTVTVTDASGCVSSASGTVATPQPLIVNARTTQLGCNETSGATISLSIRGGTRAFAIEWADLGPGVGLQVRRDLPAGTYAFTVTDAGGCDFVERVVIDPAPEFTATVSDDTICVDDVDTGTLTAAVGVTNDGLSYAWSNGDTTATIGDLAVGTYTVTITDTDAACEAVASGTVSASPAICDEPELAALGGVVFLDDNNDGLQDPAQVGVRGVTVYLKDETGAIVDSTTTDAAGEYLFPGLISGAYSVQFALPDGERFTALNAGADDELDSDADPAMNGMTAAVTLAPGDSNTSLDAGLAVTPECTVTAGVTAGPACDDNGTPADASDDTYAFTILVEGTNTSGNWVIDQTDNNGNPLVATGNYGEPYTFTGLPTLADGDNGDPVTLTVRDAGNAACLASLAFLPTGPCTSASTCEISAELAAEPTCDDNGTPSNASDDTYAFTILVEGTNTSGNWVIDQTDNNGNPLVATGNYGEPYTFTGLPTLADGDDGDPVTLTVRDAGDAACLASLAFSPTGPCTSASACEISAELAAEPTCDDNGTPNDPSDDTYTVRLRATGNGTSGFSVSDITDGRAESLGSGPSFGVTYAFGPLPIYDAAGNQRTRATYRITDSNDPECFFDLPISLPPSCSVAEECDLTIMVTDTECGDGGTSSEADDVFFFEILAEGATGDYSVEYNTPSGQINATGTFGRTVTLGPVPTGFNVSGTVTPLDHNCTDMGAFFVQSPETCGSCELTVTELSNECSRNNAGSTGGDSFTVTALVTASAGGVAYIVELPDGSTRVGMYATDSIFTADFPVTDGDVALTFRDLDSSLDCETTITFAAPTESCTPCSIDATLVRQTECDDNGTPTVPGDDFFTATFIVEGQGTGGNFLIAGTNIRGTYGAETTLTLPTGEDASLAIFDINNNRCVFVLTVEAPENCSVAPPCDITATVTGEPTCNDRGGYDVEITVANTGPSDSWRLSTGRTGRYGEPFLLNVDEACGEATFVVTDENDPTCTDTFTVAAPAPVVSCPISNHYCPILEEDIMLFPLDAYACVATFDVPTPDVTGGCSSSYSLVTSVVDASGNTVATIGPDGESRSVSLEVGDYIIRYALDGDCGGRSVTECTIRVADTEAPTAVCAGFSSISIGGSGSSRVYNTMLDLGSYDNCGIDRIEIRRERTLDPDTGDTLDTAEYGEWAEFVTLDCSDVGTDVTLALRVLDAAGNDNLCTASVTVVDNTLPYCTGLENLTLGCDEIPMGFEPTDTASLREAFGSPKVIDNCAATAIELEPEVDFEFCAGAGTILRRWLAVDAVGNVSARVFTQLITIEPTDGYTFATPVDVVTDCLDGLDGIAVIGGGCADLSVTFEDVMVEAIAADGDACLVIERTYTIVDDCVFDAATDQAVALGRDEDCDGNEGGSPLYVTVDGGTAYLDTDTDFTNNEPAAGTASCQSSTNPAGYLRSSPAAGAWTYVQRVALRDTQAPSLTLPTQNAFCTTESEDCETMITIPITLEGECTAAGARWLILVDIGGDGSIDMNMAQELAVQGSFPDYFIEAVLPVGDHTVSLRYTDGCDNGTAATVPISVVDCSIPDPVCYGGYLTDLTTLDQPVTDASGNPVQVGAVVDASILASCDVADCSGTLRYSVNRIGQTPNIDSTSVTLTCDDRYRVELEVYMWDGADNPTAIQPDSSVGGPNWKMCIVDVLVQDPAGLCTSCGATGLIALGGGIRSMNGTALPDVEVELGGPDADDLAFTNDNGVYGFTDLSKGGYQITPSKVGVAVNGISTLDEMILQRHLLGTEPITDVLQFMAADLDNSGAVNILDRIIMRRIILGDDGVLPADAVWRFVSTEDVSSTTMGTYWDIPETLTLPNVVTCARDNDFVAIKLGDLDGSVLIETSTGEVLNGNRGRSSGSRHAIELVNDRASTGDVLDIPIRVSDLETLSGMQLTLRFDTRRAEVLNVTPGALPLGNLGLQYQTEGLVSANWVSLGAGLGTQEVLFTVRVRSLADQTVGEVVSLFDQPTVTEGYRPGNDELVELFVELAEPGTPELDGTPGASSADLALARNYPNPFSDRTVIEFTLPSGGEATISVYDLYGRVLKDVTAEYAAGTHSLTLRADDLPAGTLIYTLTHGGERITRSMVRVR